MTDPRPYRAGLGLPDAVVIRSGPTPGPAPTPLPALATPFTVVDAATSTLEPPLPREQAWREWAINPAKHGPERMKGPPNFVPIQGTYDELGRSVSDGVGVDVDEGKRIKRAIEDGGSVAEWYASLSRSGSRSASGVSTPTVDQGQAGPSAPSTLKHEVIDLTNEIDEEEEEEEKPSVAVTMPNEEPTSSPAVPPPLRVDRKEWFIRRALLSKSQSTTPQPIRKPAKPSSIGSMINLDTARVAPINLPQYVLGPENKGYELLKDRLGWEGGGLGRPEGWDEAGPSDPRFRSEHVKEEAGAQQLEQVRPPIVVKHEDGREVTDLTIDSNSEDESEEEYEDDIPDQIRLGPGRTAPISTALKLDRLGIGHIRSTRTKTGESTKRVTHTHEEILQAQRRARFSSRPSDKLQLGKKGKIKWKEKDRKERDSRRRLAAALNA